MEWLWFVPIKSAVAQSSAIVSAQTGKAVVTKIEDKINSIPFLFEKSIRRLSLLFFSRNGENGKQTNVDK